MAKNKQDKYAVNEAIDESGDSPIKLPAVSSLLHFLWLKKWLILMVWVALAVPAGIALSIFNLPRAYSAATVLRFPNVIGAQTNVMRDVAITQGESIIGIFNSFQVAEAVIRRLSLRLRIETPEIFSKKAFKSVRYGDNLGLGRYTLVIGKYPWVSLLYRPKGASEEYTLFRGDLKPGNILAAEGLELALTDSLARNSEGFAMEMSFRTLEETAVDLRKTLTTHSLGASNIELRLKDRDPWLVADILNTMREEFLKVYYGTTEVQDVGILVQMEKDLEVAKEKLERSQNALSSHYAAHPELMRGPESQGDNLVYLEARQDLEASQRALKRVQSAFRAKPANATPEQIHFWCMELLGAMSEIGESRANIQRSSLQELQQRQVTLRATLGPEHPRILDVEVQKKEIVGEIEDTYASLARRLTQEVGEHRQRMSANAPTRQAGASMKVQLELERLNSENKNNQSIYQGLQESYNRAKLVTGSEFFKVTVVDPARPAIYIPPSLQSRLIVAAASVLALALLIPAVFMAWPVVFKRIWTKDDVRRLLGIKTLGALGWNESPRQAAAPAEATGSGLPDPLLLFFGSAYSIQDLEAYRVIREEAESYFRQAQKGKLCLLLTSTRPNEGKSLTACNLAMTFARKGKRTLLIDADFRLGRVDKIFNIPASTGVDELLGQPDMTDSQFIDNVSLCFQPTMQRNLVIAPRSRSNPNAGELVSSDRFKSFIRLAREQFDVVIVDTPPIMITPEPLSLVEVVDGVLFVCLSGGTVASDASEAVGILQERNVKVAAILNGVKNSPFARNQHKKYSYYYQAQPVPSGQEGS